jgi:hypothetical protein
VWPLLFLLGTGCIVDGDLRGDRHDDLPPLDEGEEEQDWLPEDTGGHPPRDTDPPVVDTGDPGDTDTDEPDPQRPQACYPGRGGGWNTCVDVVDYSSSWGSDYAYPDPYGGSAQYVRPARFVDLYDADPDLAVADNFALEELMSWRKGQYGVYQSHVVEHLQAIRDASGGSITVNSGYRSPGYNAGVGGVTSSRHMYGDAADMNPSAVSLDRLADLCYAEGADYVGMYSSFVHCDWRNDPLDSAFYDGARSGAPAPLPVHTARIVRGADGSLAAPATGFDEGEPYRLWRAYGPEGSLLTEHAGARFSPPMGCDRVVVEVGGQVAVSVELP